MTNNKFSVFIFEMTSIKIIINSNDVFNELTKNNVKIYFLKIRKCIVHTILNSRNPLIKTY